MPELDWSDLAFVLAVSRARTLAAAARRLDVDERTVARRVARAERQLRARLFDRKAGKLALTEVGSEVVMQAERMELAAQSLEQKVAGADRRLAGRVRLTAVPILINRVLIPASTGLLERHPGLELEMIADARDLSLAGREVDIALRLARPMRESLMLTRRIGLVDYSVYAASGSNARDLRWITYEDSMRDLPQAKWIASELESEPQNAPISVNDAEALYAAVRAGLGKSLLPEMVADADTGLERLRTDTPISRELWLVVHPEIRELARIDAVITWLDGIFSKPSVTK